MKLAKRIQPIRAIWSDVDGVLTDGGIAYDNQGIETKTFHVRDGLGIKLWQKAGYQFGIITARSSHIVKIRMNELGVDIVRQAAKNKLEVAQSLAQENNISLDEVCYIGDDLSDLSLLKNVGLAATVADGVDEVKSECQIVTQSMGGQGAIRELVETILKSQQHWDEILQAYTNS
jgi:YrbI family 3-deoxy-D-manno-octulosonate 8-phosphate phosphatase